MQFALVKWLMYAAWTEVHDVSPHTPVALADVAGQMIKEVRRIVRAGKTAMARRAKPSTGQYVPSAG